MAASRPGDEEADQAEPLLHGADSYSLSSFDGPRDGDDARSDVGEEKPKSRGRRHRIKPVFPEIQSFPLNVLERYVPLRMYRVAVLGLALGLWALYILFIVIRKTSLPPVPGYGVPRRLTCYSNAFGNIVERYAIPSCDSFTPECMSSRPPPFAFQCPPSCGSAHLQEEHYLGDQFIEHDIWVIGGGADGKARRSYRADSYICGAAVQAGVISDRDGGCGILTMNAGQESFLGTTANGIDSMDFNSSFPLGFTVDKVEQPDARCYDIIWTAFTVSVLVTTGISLLTKSPSVFFSTIFPVVFFQTALISDPPNFDGYLQVVQVAFARFLPAAFVGFAIYKLCARATLTGLDAHVEKTVFWLGGCWLGASDNYTLDKLPLSRLTPRDLKEPGAIAVLLCVVAAIVSAAGTQAWAFWKDGRFWRYLTMYGMFGFAIVVLIFIPGLNLRIHHYILALLLLPGTAIQTRPSLLFQGFLVGLFINGVARWGFASILETDRFLAREGQLGSELPEFLAPVLSRENITFMFPSMPNEWDGISVMVNDVERTRIARAVADTVFTWSRVKMEDLFFRFAFTKMGYVDGIMLGDFTKPGTWAANDTWLF